MVLEFFPKYSGYEIDKQNPQIQIYGHRIYKDQTLYEYLLEFLLVFISPKSLGEVNYETIKTEGFSFIETTDESKQIYYYPSPRMGLKRYIFFNRSDLEKRFEVDRNALKHHRNNLKNSISVECSNYDKDFALDVIQELFYGYNAIIGKRSWFAQSLLPLAPEIIFTESIGNKKTRTDNLNVIDSSFLDIDRKFQFNQHMFMARGGEIYYLHVLQGLNQLESKYREEISKKLKEMVTSLPQLSTLANLIQNDWECIVDAPENKKDFHYIVKTIEVIPKEYEKVAPYTVKELQNLLNSELDSFEKVELLGMLIALQIIRMMTHRSRMVLNLEKKQPWVIDLTMNPQGAIRKQAIQSYDQLEENLFRAIFRVYDEDRDVANKNTITNAAKDTSLLVRKLSKDIGLVIPPTGTHMRMTLNENLVKILVLTLIKPGERLLFTTFLEKCYERYNIIIGPREAELHFGDISYLNDFNENEHVFLELLSNCGFLKNLSDATSIVENRFKG
ncbi:MULTISPECIES: hypothetical protein [unclassified Bacillus (in: firmicutes)]|uniref:hypothetical protein n=1 Tax=unclassified Bacillus (in: firmicutes) TaxID=185979 RepID=UPI00112423C8|nr:MULTISPECIES: hypothetical protein [unclassified Bacillus (in: firmicutes)]